VIDVVDADDRVIGQASRREIHVRGLPHRAAHVWVFDSRRRLLIQRRSAAKEEWPMAWTSSASGHVDAGESYEACAVRELAEEVGLTVELEFLVKLPASPETCHEHTALFTGESDDPPRIDPVEILSVEYREIEDLREQLEQEPGQFDPPFRSLLAWYLDRLDPGTGRPGHQAD